MARTKLFGGASRPACNNSQGSWYGKNSEVVVRSKKQARKEAGELLASGRYDSVSIHKRRIGDSKSGYMTGYWFKVKKAKRQ